MAPSHILQIYLRVTVQNQIGIAQRIVVSGGAGRCRTLFRTYHRRKRTEPWHRLRNATIRPETSGNTAQFPPDGLSTAPAAAARHLRCQNARQCRVAVPASCFGAKAPRTLRPLPLLRFAVSATGGAHLCSTKYCLRFWLSICRASLAVSALRIMRCCPYFFSYPRFSREG